MGTQNETYFQSRDMTPTTRLLMLIAAGVLLACSTGDPYVPEADPVLIRANRRAEAFTEVIVVETDFAGRRVFPNIENFLEGPTPTLALYRESVTRERVVEFFVERVGSEKIALPILYYADRLNIPFSLAFSLVWAESRYRPMAINVNQGATSIDRGLFQLNSLTFPNLSEEDFFNPEVNTLYGLQFLQFGLQVGEDVGQALAIYNAGYTRVARGQTPLSTQNYVRQVLAYRDRLLADFTEYILSHFPPDIA